MGAGEAVCQTAGTGKLRTHPRPAPHHCSECGERPGGGTLHTGAPPCPQRDDNQQAAATSHMAVQPAGLHSLQQSNHDIQ